MKYWLRTGLGSGLLSASVAILFAACSGDPAPSSPAVEDAPDASPSALANKAINADVTSRALTRARDLTTRFVARPVDLGPSKVAKGSSLPARPDNLEPQPAI